MSTSSGVWDTLLKTLQAPLKAGTAHKTLLLISTHSADQKFVISHLNALNRAIKIQEREQNSDGFLLSRSLNGARRGDDLLDDAVKVANEFGVGYSFIEYRDANKDALSHLDIYTITDDSDIYDTYLEKGNNTLAKDGSFGKNAECYSKIVATFMEEYLKDDQKKSSDLLVVPILNVEHEPRQWLQFIHRWIAILKPIFHNDKKEEALTESFRAQMLHHLARDAGESRKTAAGTPTYNNITLKLGECDAPLGFQLLVSVINSQQIHSFQSSKLNPFSSEIFEYIQQVLRVVTLKHGGSIIYLPREEQKQQNSFSEQLRLIGLVASILDFEIYVPQSLSKDSNMGTVVPNLINQKTLLIPYGCDTVGKIYTVNEDFDITGFSQQWDELVTGSTTTNKSPMLQHYQQTVPTLHEKTEEPDDAGIESSRISAKQLLKETDIDFQDFLAENYKIQQKRQDTPGYKSKNLQKRKSLAYGVVPLSTIELQDNDDEYRGGSMLDKLKNDYEASKGEFEGVDASNTSVGSEDSQKVLDFFQQLKQKQRGNK